MRTRNLFLLGLGLVAVCLSSCGQNGRKPTYPVTGKVTWNGKPVEHASVVLHPVGEPGDEVARPHGKVASDGTFTLTTYDGNDGAPSGEYFVTVELWLAGRPDEGPTSRLPKKFANPVTSGLKAVVDAGPTELKPIELKR